MEEGKIVKGGVNKAPAGKRPSPPKGQRYHPANVQLWIGGKLIKPMDFGECNFKGDDQ